MRRLNCRGRRETCLSFFKKVITGYVPILTLTTLFVCYIPPIPTLSVFVFLDCTFFRAGTVSSQAFGKHLTHGGYYCKPSNKYVANTLFIFPTLMIYVTNQHSWNFKVYIFICNIFSSWCVLVSSVSHPIMENKHHPMTDVSNQQFEFQNVCNLHSIG